MHSTAADPCLWPGLQNTGELRRNTPGHAVTAAAGGPWTGSAGRVMSGEAQRRGCGPCNHGTRPRCALWVPIPPGHRPPAAAGAAQLTSYGVELLQTTKRGARPGRPKAACTRSRAGPLRTGPQCRNGAGAPVRRWGKQRKGKRNSSARRFGRAARWNPARVRA